MMNTGDRLAGLNRTIAQCRKSPYYRNRLPQKPLEDIGELKNLPFTTKEDIRSNSPFGLLCVPQSELFQYHETFGTTGMPASVWLTREDVADMARRVCMYGSDFNDNDIVLVRFPYALSVISHFTHAAAQSRNACVIPASSRNTVTPFSRVVDLMRRLNVTVLAALPLQALLIAETAEMLGYEPGKDFPFLRAVYTAGEVLTNNRRRILENAWGVPVVDNYGMTETGPMAVECKCGKLHPFEESFIYEVLDDDLVNEVEPGCTGNLVVTTLTRNALPLVRYVTGDRARLYDRNCECGESRVLQVRGRRQDVIELDGRRLDVLDFGDMVDMLGFGKYWAAGRYNCGVKLVVEKEERKDKVKKEKLKLIRAMYGDRIEIEALPPGSLHDRQALLAVSEVGKPKYIYNQEEMEKKRYIKAMKI